MNLVYLSFAPALLAPGVGARAARRIAPVALLLTAAVQAAAALAVAFRAGPATRIAHGYVTTDATARLFEAAGLRRAVPKPKEEPMPDAHSDRASTERSHEWVTMIRKLHWIGMEKEARRLRTL